MTLNGPHRSNPRQQRRDGRGRRPNRGPARPPPIPVTASGVPAAVPDVAPPSPPVFTTEASRARYPWLPKLVIAGSVWRGPGHQKVKVDAEGEATPWPPPRP